MLLKLIFEIQFTMQSNVGYIDYWEIILKCVLLRALAVKSFVSTIKNIAIACPLTLKIERFEAYTRVPTCVCVFE